MTTEIDIACSAFYTKLFEDLKINKNLVKSKYPVKYIFQMTTKEYAQYSLFIDNYKQFVDIITKQLS